jgi:CRP-like cAMP-binding protein
LIKNIVSKSYKKGDFIVKEGEICDRIFIIREGLVRGFFNYNKTEITNWVSVDNEMVTSISGYFKNEPVLENIQCIEDTHTESLSYDDMHYLLENHKDVVRLNRILMEHYYVQAEYRAFMARIPLATDRYKYFIKITNPEIVKRLPKKYLASMLNMRPETLSRLNM